MLSINSLAKYDLWSSDRIHAEIKHDPISGLYEKSVAVIHVIGVFVFPDGYSTHMAYLLARAKLQKRRLFPHFVA